MTRAMLHRVIIAAIGFLAGALVMWLWGPPGSVAADGSVAFSMGWPTAIVVGSWLMVSCLGALLPGSWPGRVAGVAFCALLLILGVMHVGWRETAVLTAGIAFVSSMLWYPPWLMRLVGALLLALFLFVFLKVLCGLWLGAAIAVAATALAWRFLPTRVHRRVGFMVPSMVMLVFITTVLMYGAPGSPFASEKQTTQQALEAMSAKFNVKDSAYEYFVSYMHDLLVNGTMGLSIKVQGRTVEQLLMPALPVSMSLGLLALVLACLLGLTMGIRAGLKPNSMADYSSMGLAMVGISLPNFVIGACLLIVFSYGLGWLPVAGWGTYGHLILPAITLALPYAAYIARLVRNGTIEVMQQDFVRTARAKGLSEREVVLKHALKGAVLPVVSFLGPAAAGIFTGSFVVETLFAIPGMGQWFVKGALGRDYSVVLGTAIIYFTIITLFNLLVDFAYAWLDPRVREEL
ncbi:MAG: ABC transporter permease [Planctomycetota bacterium]|nr:ABC transporter permease [Planctomycetota bacterium]